jgi:hypothetical protein
VDTQRVLPFGSPQEVQDEVKRRIDDLAPVEDLFLQQYIKYKPWCRPKIL